MNLGMCWEQGHGLSFTFKEVEGRFSLGGASLNGFRGLLQLQHSWIESPAETRQSLGSTAIVLTLRGGYVGHCTSQGVVVSLLAEEMPRPMAARAMDPAHHVPENSLCIGIPPSGRTLTGVEVCESCAAPFYGLG